MGRPKLSLATLVDGAQIAGQFLEAISELTEAVGELASSIESAREVYQSEAPRG